MENYKKILLVKPDGIGDFILFTPFLRTIREAQPDALIVLVCAIRHQELLVNCPYIDDYFCLFNGLNISENDINNCAEQLLSRYGANFDLSINVRWDADYYGASLFTYKINAKIRLSYSEKSNSLKTQINKGFDEFSTHVIDDNIIEHEVLKNLNMLQYLGIECFNTELELWPGINDFQYIEKLISPTQQYIVCGVGTTVLNQKLTSRSWINLINAIKASFKYEIVLLGGVEDKSVAVEIKKSTSITDLVGVLTLNQSAAVISKSFVCICFDSSIKHIAAAVKSSIIEIVAHPSNLNQESPHSSTRFGSWQANCLRVHPTFLNSPCSLINKCESQEPHCILNLDIDAIISGINNLQYYSSINKFALNNF
jgi:heptosyltransferase-3